MNTINQYKSIFIAIFLLFIAQFSFGQSFKATVSKTNVQVGETFQVSFAINTSASEFNSPKMDGFKILGGPNQSTSMSVVNGKVSRSLTLSYYLQATKEGTFQIGSASIKAKNKVLKTNPIEINVVEGATANNNNSGENPNEKELKPSENLAENIFLKTQVNKTNVVKGEQIVLTYKLYTRLSLNQYNITEMPQIVGFWSQEFDIGNEVKVEIETIDGVEYKAATFKKLAIFPTKSGKLKVPGMKMDVSVIVEDKDARPRDFFDAFFGRGRQKVVPMSLTGQTKTITVSELPTQNKPQSFSGAVGKYKLTTSITPTSLTTDDAITLKLFISGTGNIKAADAPKLNLPRSFEVYDPKVKESIYKKGEVISGSKTLEYLIIPQKPGTFKLEPLEFSYYNPSTKKYQSTTIPLDEITVVKGENYVAEVNPTEVEILDKDIRYIKEETTFSNGEEKPFSGSMLFWSLNLIPLLAFLGFVGYKKLTPQKDADELRKSNAYKKYVKSGKKREQLLQNDDQNGFLKEITANIEIYLSEKLDIPLSQLNKPEIMTQLNSREVPTETISLTENILDQLQMFVYGGLDAKNSNQLQTDAQSLVEIIEKQIS